MSMKKTVLVSAIVMSFLCTTTFAEKVTLQATLVSDTMCESSNPDVNYEASNFGLNEPISAFYYGRDHSTVTRFAALQMQLPICPEGMRAVAARIRIYAAESNRGLLAFARLKDNPDLSSMTWNSAVADDYIEGVDAAYRLDLDTNTVALTGAMSGGSVPAWYTYEILASSLADWFDGDISSTQSNLVTLLTRPLSGYGNTLWRGGHLEEGHGAELEVDFIPVNMDVPVTDNLLIALQPEGLVLDGAGGVAAWTDSSAYGGWQDFVQSQAKWRPSVVTNEMYEDHFREVVDFNSTLTQHLDLASSSIMDGNTWSWYIVFNPDVVNGTHILFRGNYASGADSSSPSLWGTFQADSQDDIIFSTRGSTGGISFYGHIPPGADKWCVSGGAWNGTTAAINGRAATSIAAVLRDASNGDIDLNRNSNTTGANAVPAGHVMSRIGAEPSAVVSSATAYNGQMVEILVYKTALSEDDESEVMDYLYRKYFQKKGLLILLQ